MFCSRAFARRQDSFRHMRCACMHWLSSLLAVGVLLLAGCASLDPVDHPQEWRAGPSAVLANGCPDLSGTYSIHPSGVYPSDLRLQPTLNEALSLIILRNFSTDREKPWPELAGATKAVFATEGEWLYVSLRDDAEGRASVRFKRKRWWGGFHEESDAMPLCI